MTPLLALQLLGLGMVALTAIFATISYQMWKRLPVDKKVWAMVVWIGYCGIISFYPWLLAYLYGAQT